MKQFILLISLTSMFFSVATLKATEKNVFFSCVQNENVPDFSFDHHTFDFGKFPKKEKKSHTFVFTNTGNAPLVILHIATGCGCTTTSYTKEPIQPGKKGEVKVQYDGSGQRAGMFRKSVTIYTNSPKNYTRLFITGETIN